MNLPKHWFWLSWGLFAVFTLSLVGRMVIDGLRLLLAWKLGR